MVWFSGSANLTMPVTFGLDIPLTLVAMATKICDFQHKMGYNSAYAGDTPQMLAPTRGLSGLANLMVSVKLCHGNEKLGILPENLPFHRLYIR